MNKKLRALIDRAERLIAEREEANEGLRDLRKECKSDGYEPAQILRLAQLSHDDKKRAKLAAANEVLSLYNRESGLGLDLGLDEIPEPDRAAVTSAPAGGGGKGVAQTMPPRPEPIPQSEAAVPTRGISRGKPAEVASDTASPAGASPPNCAADCDPAPDAASPRSGPAGETKGGPDTASLAFTSAAARREGQDSAGTDDLTIPPHLRRGTAANARARGL